MYDRWRARGRTHVPLPEGDHVVVEDFREPVFAREETVGYPRPPPRPGGPPRQTTSGRPPMRLVYCHCGSRIQAANKGEHEGGHVRARRDRSQTPLHGSG